MAPKKKTFCPVAGTDGLFWVVKGALLLDKYV